MIGSEWIDKYAPKKLKHVILPLEYMNFLNKVVEDDVVPNMLLESSSPGTGKSTIMKVLAKEMGLDTLFINASADGGIATLREDITRFAMTTSLGGATGKPKLVMLDEADGLSQQMQKALRGAMDEHKEYCRFWMTCNYEHQIIGALKDSRMKKFSFNMGKKEYREELIPLVVQRMQGILTKEKVTYDEAALAKFVDARYPDIRATINILEQFGTMCGHIDERILSYKVVDDKLTELILAKDILSVRRFVVENGYDYDQLYTYLFNEIVPKISVPKNKAYAISLIRNGMVDSVVAIDKEIVFVDTLLQIVGVM